MASGWGLFFCLFGISCANDGDCLTELRKKNEALQSAFAKGDSSAVLRLQEGTSDLVECVKSNVELPEVQKGEATRLQERIEETADQLQCKCYATRLKAVHKDIMSQENMDDETWKSLYARWGEVVSSTDMGLSALTKKCHPDDFSDITTMKAEVQTQHGYMLSKDAMDAVQEGMNKLISTSKGIWKGIEESLEENKEE